MSTAIGAGANWFSAARATDVLLQALGGVEVKLLVPVTQESADVTSGMGIAAAVVEELALSPALVRKSRKGTGVEVVVGAESLRTLGATDDQRIEDVMSREARVRVGERVMRIAAIEAEYFAGVEYLYRLQVED